MYKESKNVVVKHLVNRLRDVRTASNEFRLTIEEISRIVASEALADFPTITTNINTWQGPLDVETLEVQKIVLVPILRAGLGMVDGIQKVIPTAKVGHIGLYRNETTLMPHEYYSKFPKEITNATVLVVDPMLATGGSVIAAIDRVKKAGAKDIRYVGIVGCPEGIKALQGKHPDVDIYMVSIDQKLNEIGYIVPGLGDCGDRLFGTK